MTDDSTWPLNPGVQLKRSEIHKLEVGRVRVGGRQQHGITSCLGGTAHLVFMGEGGEENGYGKHDYFIDDKLGDVVLNFHVPSKRSMDSREDLKPALCVSLSRLDQAERIDPKAFPVI